MGNICSNQASLSLNKKENRYKYFQPIINNTRINLKDCIGETQINENFEKAAKILIDKDKISLKTRPRLSQNYGIFVNNVKSWYSLKPKNFSRFYEYHAYHRIQT